MKRNKNIKIWLPRLLLLTLFLVFAKISSFSQVPTGQSDTTQIIQAQTQEQAQEQAQTREEAQARGEAQVQEKVKNQNQGEVQKPEVGKTIKQVKRSARPDMSKAKGARPNIVRPAGSKIPKGVGKPGGMKRLGGR